VYSRILVGFENTEQGRDALELGRVLAHTTGASLLVATVCPPDLGFLGYSEHRAEMRRASERLASQTLSHLPESELALQARYVSANSPASGLQHLAEAEGAEVIVVGSTHRGTLGRILPGSVGERLLTGSACAVAVAPRGFAEAQARRRPGRQPSTNGGRGADDPGPRVIGIGFDGSAQGEEALRVAARLAERTRAALRVIAVAPSHSHAQGLGSARAEVHAAAVQLYLDLQDRLQDAVAELPGDLRPQAIFLRGDPASVLLSMAAQGVDLLVVGSRGRHGPVRRVLLGSVSRAVMHRAPCPVLIIPRIARAPLSAPTRASTAVSAMS
jgi:nucleotide-binding universal stress UspA family protein